MSVMVFQADDGVTVTTPTGTVTYSHEEWRDFMRVVFEMICVTVSRHLTDLEFREFTVLVNAAAQRQSPDGRPT